MKNAQTIMASDAALSALRKSAKSLSLDAISENTIKLSNESFSFNTQCSFRSGDKNLSYSLISIFLLIQDPKISVVKYRQICGKYKVEDSVKTLDKGSVLDYFLGGASTTEEGSIEERHSERGDGQRSKEKHGKREKSHKSRKRHARDEEKGTPSSKKKEKTPITHQQIMENLNIVVDKRGEKPEGSTTKDASGTTADVEMTDASKGEHEGGGATGGEVDEPPKLLSQEDEERRAIQACLSAAGYEATGISQEVLEMDRAEVTEKITNFEIPVGDSASILRCGATATNNENSKQRGGASSSDKNFSRVLKIYMESLKDRRPDKRDNKRSHHSSAPSSAKKPAKPTGKPIIIVPNAMTSPITLLNSMEFFQKARFIPRNVILKTMSGPKPTSVTFKRSVSSRLGGGEIEYEIIDNPVRKLKRMEDWDRVVAVIAQGAAWQFKGWKMVRNRDANPVDVFSNAFGYYIGFEGAPVPKELLGWNVKKGALSKDKRGLDSVVYASFWNSLDEWMSVHKRNYLPA